MAAAQFMEWNGTALVPLTAREVGVMVESRRNLVPNASSGTNITGYAVNKGTGGAGTLARDAGAGFSGAGFARHTWTTGTSAPSGFFEYTMPDATLVAGKEYAFASYVRSSRATLMAPRIQWRAGSPVISSTIGPSLSIPANTWTRLVMIGTAPATTTGARLDVDVVAGGANWAVGDTLDWDALLLEQFNSGAVVRPYFDGSLTNTAQNEYAWLGTAHASASIEKAIEFKAVAPVIV